MRYRRLEKVRRAKMSRWATAREMRVEGLVTNKNTKDRSLLSLNQNFTRNAMKDENILERIKSSINMSYG